MSDPTMLYHNAEQLESDNIDPTPRHGDHVKWLDNGIEWSVSWQDDLNPQSQTAIAHWPEDSGRWNNVILVTRK